MLYEIAYGEDIKTFIWAILYVAIIYTIGSYINLLTIFYICLVCLLTIPVLYLQYQEVVDNFIGENHGESAVLTDGESKAGRWACRSKRERERMSQRIHKLTKELSVEIQVSFFEEANNAHYNSVSIGYVDEVTSVFIGSCIFLMGQQPQPQTTYNLSNASICAFVLTVCVSFNKAFYRILINGNTLSISKFCFWMVRRYKNRDNWQYQPVDQARPEDWSVQFEVRERQIERYITLNIVCSWVTNGLSLKLKDDLLKLKNPSLESVKTENILAKSLYH
uniref:Reticulon-like protein n=1 Tax=Brassica campestris TaxID=3711 RepID=M4DCW9_BRACM